MKAAARILPLILAVVAASPVLGDSAGAAAEGAPGRFARISTADGRPEALQVAIASYDGRNTAGSFTVDLVSAVHIGDRAYYESLNERFREYDALLFELIVPEQPDSPETGNTGANLLSGTQIGLKNLLGLAFQLDEIDYGAANFVHADLTADGLSQSMSERGESVYVYFWRLLVASIEEYTRDPFGIRRSQRLSGAMGAEPGNALKVAMAYQMVEAMRAGDILAGPDGSAIIDARNEHAIRVLRSRLDAGARKVGIFYGVAHMPDFERRLLGDLALTRSRTQWVDAWRLSDAVSASQPVDPGR